MTYDEPVFFSSLFSSGFSRWQRWFGNSIFTTSSTCFQVNFFFFFQWRLHPSHKYLCTEYIVMAPLFSFLIIVSLYILVISRTATTYLPTLIHYIHTNTYIHIPRFLKKMSCLICLLYFSCPVILCEARRGKVFPRQQFRDLYVSIFREIE